MSGPHVIDPSSLEFAVPFGYLVAVALTATPTLCALAPLRRPPVLDTVSFRLGVALNELPFIPLYFLLGSTLLAFGQGDVNSPGGWATFGLAVLTTLGLAVVARRGLRARPAIDAALAEAFGAKWRTNLDSNLAAGPRRQLPWARILFRPVFAGRREVEHVANIRYGNAGKRNLLDVYHHRSRPGGGPILIHLHGGGYVSGRKNSQSLPLLHRLASQGWVCISANYRLRPAVGFPEHLIDAKKVIAWARQHAHEYGADPAALFMAGSSAGAHLTALAALTTNNPRFQPGFEQADTSVTAAVCLNGYYGPYYNHSDTQEPPSSPHAYIRPEAPPFFLAHGDHDTVVPVETARQFAERLRRSSSNPVVYVELPSAQHAFDLFHSVRFEAVIDAIEQFAVSVTAQASGRGGHRAASAQAGTSATPTHSLHGGTDRQDPAGDVAMAPILHAKPRVGGPL